MHFFRKSITTLPRLLRVATLTTLLAVAPSAFAVDVNTASQEQLLTVRGIGPKTAQIIIEERNRGGLYHSIEDLPDRVKGIGPKKAATMQAAGLTVEGAAPAPDAATAIPDTAAQPADKPQPKRRAR